jgi:hypothetical protein
MDTNQVFLQFNDNKEGYSLGSPFRVESSKKNIILRDAYFPLYFVRDWLTHFYF